MNRSTRTLLAGAAITAATVGFATTAHAADENDPAYWQNTGEHTPSLCFKHEGGWYQNGHGTGNGKTFTLAPFNPEWDFGDHWELLVVKAGTERIVTVHPVVGQAYPAPDGKDISHVIVCKGEGEDETVETTTTAAPTTTAVVATTLPPQPTTSEAGGPTTTVAPASSTIAPRIDMDVTPCVTSAAGCPPPAQVTGAQQLPETGKDRAALLAAAGALLAIGTTLMLVRRRPT